MKMLCKDVYIVNCEIIERTLMYRKYEYFHPTPNKNRAFYEALKILKQKWRPKK